MSDRGPHSSSTPSAAGRSRRSGVIVFALALIGLGIAACDGDTLYDPVGPLDPAAPDSIVLWVLLEYYVPDRMELTDSIFFRVSGWDPRGRNAIESVGYSAIVRSTASGETRTFSQNTAFEAAPGDTVSADFAIHPEWLSPTDLPSAFTLELHAYARSRAGVCAAVAPGIDERFECRTIQVEGQSLTVGPTKGEELLVLAVRGRTTDYASAIVVGDMQVDTVRQSVFLSNRASNRLHVFRPASHSWDPDVAVGSEPWGLHLNRTGDTLLVANSGGTSISYVSLSGTPREIVEDRLHVRNTALFEVEIGADSLLVNRVRFIDFSDRPQFVAQDANGRVLYSTRPTVANPRGTVRVIERQPGWDEHETRVLVRLPDDLDPFQGVIAVAHVDSIIGYGDGRIVIWDHVPGFPRDSVFSSDTLPVLQALRQMRNDPRSDIAFMDPFDDPNWIGGGTAWMLSNVSFADTTYVAASRDRGQIAFGDGGLAANARVVLWHTETAAISARLSVEDLVNNASERVRALDLNSDGSFGVARGAFGTYFFTQPLRAMGNVPEFFTEGGGAVLHTDHPKVEDPPVFFSSPRTLAFTATGDGTLRILDTVHYQQRGLIPFRDPVAGPLRVTPPLPSDNNGQGSSCSGPTCVVAKVFAVTTGGMLVLDVHASDILPVN